MDMMITQWKNTGLMGRIGAYKKVFQENRNPKRFDKNFDSYTKCLDQYGLYEKWS